MHKRYNKRKDKSDKKHVAAHQEMENPRNEESSNYDRHREIVSDSRIFESEEAKKIYEELQALRESINGLKGNGKSTDVKESAAPYSVENQRDDDLYFADTEEIVAAKEAILQQAKKDREEDKRKQAEAIRRRQILVEESRRIKEEQLKIAKMEAEAEQKRREAIEAEKRAKDASIRRTISEMEAAIKESKDTNDSEADYVQTSDAESKNNQCTNEEMQRKRLDKAYEALLKTQTTQEGIIEHVSKISEKKTGMLAEEQQIKLGAQKDLIDAELAKNNMQLKEWKKARKEERQREKALLKQEKKAAAQRARRIRAQKAVAEMGGGVVKVKGVSINTEIKAVATFSLKDFLGIAGRSERKAKSKAEKRRLKEERESRREESRAVAHKMSIVRAEKYRQSSMGKRIQKWKGFCDVHKTGLIAGFSVLLMIIVGIAGVFNYYTVYAYSYNGQHLGYVKAKDDVLKITDLVQGALTEEKEINVVIDARKDISFDRVYNMGNLKADSTEEILKRLTYMGDLNVKAYGVYVDGKKIGAVDSKETAANVMQDIKDKYTIDMENAKIEEAVFLEKVDVRLANTDLQDLSDQQEMVDKLCTSGKKESIHRVVAGETLADIAKLYTISEEEILADNQGIKPEKLTVGSTLVIKQNAPVLTVKITETLTYNREIDFEVIEQNSDDIYEGYSEVKQEGEKGQDEITSRIVSVNGEKVEEIPLVTSTKKEAVPKVILIGTKERPPTVGSGKYIWPLSSGYSITSKFGSRWGRLHSGVDLGTPVGNSVVAADGGTVKSAGYSGSYGYLVIIDHQNGMETYYAHNSKLLVKEGDKVFQGQQIALSGNTGRSTGAHLHFEIRVGGVPTNPLEYLP